MTLALLASCSTNEQVGCELGHFTPSPAVPLIHARVTAVSETTPPIVAISAHAEPGQHLSVYRDSRFIAKLSVVFAFENHSECRILFSTEAPRVGDLAATRFE